jgi:hypothetical protein
MITVLPYSCHIDILMDRNSSDTCASAAIERDTLRLKITLRYENMAQHAPSFNQILTGLCAPKLALLGYHYFTRPCRGQN